MINAPRLALLGILLGVAYIVAMFCAPYIFGYAPILIKAEIHQIETEGLPDESICSVSTVDKKKLETNIHHVSFGKKPEYHLVRITGSVSSDGAVLYFGSMLDQAQLFICDANSTVQKQMHTGDTLPFSVRPLKVPEMAFPLNEQEAKQTIILKTVQEAFIALPINVMERSAFLEFSDSKISRRQFFIGAISLMILYNFVLSLLVKNPAFTFNALTIFSMLILNVYLSGYGAAFIWPSYPELSNILLAISEAGPTLFAPLFVFYFLREDTTHSPFDYPSYYLWPVASLIFLAMTFVFPQWIGLVALIALWILAAIYFSIILIKMARLGNERASILIVALCTVAIPTMVLGIFKEFFGWNFGLVGEHITEITLISEALLFTLALAYLLRVAENEKLDALIEKNQIAEQSKQHLLHVIDVERARIAGELHDSAGQGIVTIVNRLGRLRTNMGLSNSNDSELADTERLTKGLLKEIREISHELYPPALDHLGLNGAIKSLIKQVANANPVKFSLNNTLSSNALDKDQQLQVFRIIQELLVNVMKHSKASNCTIELKQNSQTYMINITDDGLGVLNTNKNSDDHGIGHTIINQRLATLGGNMKTSSDNSGSNICITFPAELKDGGM